MPFIRVACHHSRIQDHSRSQQKILQASAGDYRNDDIHGDEEAGQGRDQIPQRYQMHFGGDGVHYEGPGRNELYQDPDGQCDLAGREAVPIDDPQLEQPFPRCCLAPRLQVGRQQWNGQSGKRNERAQEGILNIDAVVAGDL